MKNGSEHKSLLKSNRLHRVLIVDDNNVLTSHKVINISADTIETDSDILFLKDSVKFYDSGRGGFVYLFNVPLPSKVEAHELKKLRRSSLLNNVLNFDNNKEINFPFYITAGLLALALIFHI